MSDANRVNFTSQQPSDEFPGVYDVMAEEVLTQKDRICLIDVRQPSEFRGELGHIGGSQLIVLDTLEGNMDKIPRDKTVVFICRSGRRSGMACFWAQEQGFTSVYNMQGGMLRWNELGYAVEGS